MKKETTRIPVPFSWQSWIGNDSGLIEFNGLFPPIGLDYNDLPDYEIIAVEGKMPDLFFIFESEVDAVEFKLKFTDILI